MDYIAKEQITEFIRAIYFSKKRIDRIKPFLKKNLDDRESDAFDVITNIPPQIKIHNRFIKKLNHIFSQEEEAIMLKVQPFGLERMCHANSEILVDILGDDFERVVGYNLTYCKCGKAVGAEIHSVVRHKKSNTYVDITKDYGGLTQKLFYPIKGLTDIKADYFYVSNSVLDLISSGGDYHKCVDIMFGFKEMITIDTINVNYTKNDIQNGVINNNNLPFILSLLKDYKNEGYDECNLNELVLTEIEKMKKRGEYYK